VSGSSIVLSAIVGAGVSLFVAVAFNSLHALRSQRRRAPKYQSRDSEIWE
jgi:hypothetical protein